MFSMLLLATATCLFSLTNTADELQDVVSKLLNGNSLSCFEELQFPQLVNTLVSTEFENGVTTAQKKQRRVPDECLEKYCYYTQNAGSLDPNVAAIAKASLMPTIASILMDCDTGSSINDFPLLRSYIISYKLIL